MQNQCPFIKSGKHSDYNLKSYLREFNRVIPKLFRPERLLVTRKSRSKTPQQYSRMLSQFRFWNMKFKKELGPSLLLSRQKMQFRWSCLLPETAIYMYIYHRNLLWSCPWRMHEAVYYNDGLIWQLLPIKSKYFCMKLVRCCFCKSTSSAKMIRGILGFIPPANRSKCDFVTRRSKLP